MSPTQPLFQISLFFSHMENPTILSGNINGRRSSASNSPEFEFWMTRNPSSQETTLHSADELFSGGILLPLQLLNSQNADDPPDKEDIPVSSNLDLNAGKIFKKNPESKEEKEKKKKERWRRY